MRLLKRYDPIPDLFSLYDHSLLQLANGQDAENILRYFELGLLQSLGYEPFLDREATGGQAIEQHRIYWYKVEAGPVSTRSENSPALHGETLLALARGQTLNQKQKHEALRLMRYILGFYLGDKPLKSRELFA